MKEIFENFGGVIIRLLFLCGVINILWGILDRF